MKQKFKKFIEHRKGTYGACKYSNESSVILKEWMEHWGIPNPIDPAKFHTTIIYSRAEIDKKYQISISEAEMKKLDWVFSPTELAMFGEGDQRILVLKLLAPQLNEMHETLLLNGATFDYPEYNPHVTLSYDVPEGYDWQRIVPPPVNFIPSSVYFEPLDLNWEGT